MSSGNRILVTGASGFLGRNSLVPLQRLGFEVHALSSKPAADAVSGQVRWHQANLFEVRQTQAVVESVRPTHLLHFAWYAEPGRFWNSPINLDCLTATLSLLKAFAEAGGKRFVGAGSCAEYDWNGKDAFEESDPLLPGTLYGAAKSSAYLTGAAYAKTAGIEFAWGRIFNLFGPHEAPVRIVPALIRAHLWGERLDCGEGIQLRDFLPAAVIADAFAHICDSGIQGAINIGSGEPVSIRGLSEKIAQAIGRQGDVRFGTFQDTGPAKILPSLRRLTREVGWKPPMTVDAGLAETIEWWKSQGKSPKSP
ncbi:MAG: NAD(P)-dependent oxidoreductase [Fibrobacteres bacterium]|nr:NAD(P)-dependent oxidoreductase [Fibrobacterota bacterium]